MIPALVVLLIPVAMFVGIMVLTYAAWLKWDQFAQFMIHINRYNPFFKYYAWFYRSDMGKWFYRIFPLILGLFLWLMVRDILTALKIR